MAKSVKERRAHRMYVTHNSEYHFRGQRCVAVRDRQRGQWLLAHGALDRQLTGAVRVNGDQLPYPTLESPCVGDALFFGADGPDLITSPIVTIERPSKEVVDSYPL